MYMALPSGRLWPGVEGVGASGRKGLLATKVAALGLVGTKPRATVPPILYSTTFQRGCLRRKPRSLSCRDSSRALLSLSSVGTP